MGKISVFVNISASVIFFWTNKTLLHCNYHNYCKDTVNFALAGQRERDEEVGRRPQWHLKTQVFEPKYLKNHPDSFGTSPT